MQTRAAVLKTLNSFVAQDLFVVKINNKDYFGDFNVDVLRFNPTFRPGVGTKENIKQLLPKTFYESATVDYEGAIRRHASELCEDGICENLQLFYGEVTAPDSLFLLCERGQTTLQELLTSKHDGFDYEDCMSILEQIFAGLHALDYYHNIIHNNITAGNILCRLGSFNGETTYGIYGKELTIKSIGYVMMISGFDKAYDPHRRSILNDTETLQTLGMSPLGNEAPSKAGYIVTTRSPIQTSRGTLSNDCSYRQFMTRAALMEGHVADVTGALSIFTELKTGNEMIVPFIARCRAIIDSFQPPASDIPLYACDPGLMMLYLMHENAQDIPESTIFTQFNITEKFGRGIYQ